MFQRLSPSLRHRLYFLIGGNLLLLAVIYGQLTEGASFSEVLLRAGPNVAPTMLAGLGLTGIIFAGAIDLSIGVVIVLAGTVFGICYSWGAGPLTCYAACFLTAVFFSNLNGYLIRILGIPAIIVTLAGLTFYRGLALILADVCLTDFGGQISLQNEAYHAPGQHYANWILGAALLVALFWEAFGKTPRTWLALGCSPEACRLKGLQPGKILQTAFGIGGLFLGLAALIDVTNRQVIEPARMAQGFELHIVGAVVLGGTNIFGGEGSFTGTVLGAFFLYLIGQVLLYLGISEYYRTAIQGALIIAVIGFDCALHRRQKMLDELQ